MSVVTWPHHLLTLDDWVALPEDNSRVYELVEGVLVVSPRPGLLHQRVVWRLAAQLEPQLSQDVGVLTEAEVVLDAGPPPTVRVPDVLVVPARVIDADRPRCQPDEVLLAVEVISLGSKRTDTVTKFAEYAEVGIEQYWIVDLNEPTSLAAYRLIDGDYENFGEFSNTATVEFAGAPVTIELATLTSGHQPS